MTSIQVYIDDAANGVVVNVWVDEDLRVSQTFDGQSAQQNTDRATRFADRMSREFGVEWESN